MKKHTLLTLCVTVVMCFVLTIPTLAATVPITEMQLPDDIIKVKNGKVYEVSDSFLGMGDNIKSFTFTLKEESILTITNFTAEETSDTEAMCMMYILKYTKDSFNTDDIYTTGSMTKAATLVLPAGTYLAYPFLSAGVTNLSFDWIAVKELTTINLKCGTTLDIKGTVAAKYTTNKKEVATVNKNGVITAQNTGYCVITVKTELAQIRYYIHVI